MTASSILSKFLVNPTKAASMFEWKKAHSSIMCLDIRKHNIGVAVAKHPHCSSVNTSTSASTSASTSTSTSSHQQIHQYGYGCDYDDDATILYEIDTSAMALPQITKSQSSLDYLKKEEKEGHDDDNDNDDLQQQQQQQEINQWVNEKLDQDQRKSQTLTQAQAQAQKQQIDDITMHIHQKLESIIHENQVCAFIIHWPISSYGRSNESCGRVLYTLDKLVAISSSSSLYKSQLDTNINVAGINTTSSSPSSSPSSILRKNRPFALFSLSPDPLKDRHDDDDHSGQSMMIMDEEDEWGRNANLSYREYNPCHLSFSSKSGVVCAVNQNDNGNDDGNDEHHNDSTNDSMQPIKKPLSLSSLPSSPSSSSVANKVLNQFLQSYWPDDDVLMSTSNADSRNNMSTSTSTRTNTINMDDIIFDDCHNQILEKIA